MLSLGSVSLPTMRACQVFQHSPPCISIPTLHNSFVRFHALLGKQITSLEKAIENSAVLLILYWESPCSSLLGIIHLAHPCICILNPALYTDYYIVLLETAFYWTALLGSPLIMEIDFFFSCPHSLLHLPPPPTPASPSLQVPGSISAVIKPLLFG